MEEKETSEPKKEVKHKKIILHRKERKNIPTIVKFKKKDGTIVTIKAQKIIIVPKKITFIRKKSK